jgi:hypothetical protein
MDQIFLVYKTDTWHSYKSRDIIGVATSEENAVSICQEQAKKEGEEISEQELWNLQNLKQTQGYQGEGEFQFEAIITDTLL